RHNIRRCPTPRFAASRNSRLPDRITAYHHSTNVDLALDQHLWLLENYVETSDSLRNAFSAASSRAINRTMKSNFNRRYDSSICSGNLAKICGIALVHSFWTAGIMMAGSTTVSNYELKRISLPGASGVVDLDY